MGDSRLGGRSRDELQGPRRGDGHASKHGDSVGGTSGVHGWLLVHECEGVSEVWWKRWVCRSGGVFMCVRVWWADVYALCAGCRGGVVSTAPSARCPRLSPIPLEFESACHVGTRDDEKFLPAKM